VAKRSTLPDMDLSAAMRGINDGLVFKPVLMHYLATAPELHWPEMLPRDFGVREPDGYFHPSTHPGWSLTQLYDYLVTPDRLQPERFDYSTRMSLLFGVAAHLFLNEVSRKAGLLPPELQACVICPPEDDCQEPSFLDPLTGERGHADGRHSADDLVEFKTSSDHRIRRLQDLETDLFLEYTEAWGYRQQAWRYQRAFGAKRTIFLVWMTGSPWDIKEFHHYYDPDADDEVTEKFLTAQVAADERRRPPCSCVRSDLLLCPSRDICS
jgi:hypothetical protein